MGGRSTASGRSSACGGEAAMSRSTRTARTAALAWVSPSRWCPGAGGRDWTLRSPVVHPEPRSGCKAQAPAVEARAGVPRLRRAARIGFPGFWIRAPRILMRRNFEYEITTGLDADDVAEPDGRLDARVDNGFAGAAGSPARRGSDSARRTAGATTGSATGSLGRRSTRSRDVRVDVDAYRRKRTGND